MALGAEGGSAICLPPMRLGRNSLRWWADCVGPLPGAWVALGSPDLSTHLRCLCPVWDVPAGRNPVFTQTDPYHLGQALPPTKGRLFPDLWGP